MEYDRGLTESAFGMEDVILYNLRGYHKPFWRMAPMVIPDTGDPVGLEELPGPVNGVPVGDVGEFETQR